ncbi:MAG TPA: DNA polymerase IV [Dehalococcoidia bacterium]|nr:DNA polymerase IV [Dehalococcoidia bacterium]
MLPALRDRRVPTAGAAFPGPRLPHRVAHCDLDTFFVAVERLHDRSLIDRPVLVGGGGPRGVVASASYEARTFGCHSAQPMSQALRLCPQAAVVPPRFDRYQSVSRDFHRILNEASPVVESVGIDEAYIDLTGIDGTTSSEAARGAGERIRARVREELGIAVSICIAGSRTTAKVGSDLAKPDGLIEVPAGEEAAFLAPWPVRDLPSVGPKFGAELASIGVRTIGEAATLDRDWVVQRFGRAGEVLHDRARGVDPTPIRAGGRPARSMSREVTFNQDVTDIAALRRTLRRHAERVGTDLRRAGRRCRTVTLKVRWSDFTTLTRSHTLERPAQSTAALAAAGEALLDQLLRTERMRPVRLIGLGATNLADDITQLSFDELRPDETETRRQERLDRALDDLHDRFGSESVNRGGQ